MRHGKSLRERTEALGFTNQDWDERVHDLLDWVEGVVETCEKYQEEKGEPKKGLEAVEAVLDDSSLY